MSNEKKKRGQPTKYKPEFAEKAFIFCSENGFTDKKLCLAFNCSERTLNYWKKNHPEFLQSIKDGKDEFDSEVAEKSLLKKVKGYSATEVTREPMIIRKRGTDPSELVSPEMAVTKRVRKHFAPDTTALIFFLKNRRPKRWRDKQQLELEFNAETLNAVLAGLPAEYAEAVRAELVKAVAKR